MLLGSWAINRPPRWGLQMSCMAHKLITAQTRACLDGCFFSHTFANVVCARHGFDGPGCPQTTYLHRLLITQQSREAKVRNYTSPRKNTYENNPHNLLHPHYPEFPPQGHSPGDFDYISRA